MLNPFVIVWRESLEAMLVIGVLTAWIARQPSPAGLMRGVWAGAALGVALACGLGAATYAVQTQFAGAALDYFQLGMILAAAGLILQMVLWMHRHGRHMKRELETRAAGSTGALGIAAVTALAVAREGAETVVFLYGLGVESAGEQLVALAGAACAGLLLAGASSWLIARGTRFFDYRTLFRVSEVLLLLIANALLANGIDRMIALGWLPPLMDAVWDTSGVLGDGRGLGRFLADFVGYRAQPAGTLLVASLLFWTYAWWRLWRPQRAGA